jgi:hypothetical protein
LVINIAFDRGQRPLEPLLNGKNRGWH